MPRLRAGERVLIATHGLPTADAAVRWGSTFAAHQGLPVDVLAVIDPLAGPTPFAEAGVDYAELDRVERAALHDTVAAQLARVLPGVTVAVEFETGAPAELIARRAGTTSARLIVLGRGRHAMANRLLGDEAAIGVLRQSQTPVLAVTPDAAPSPVRIIIATDFSASATRAAELALAMASPASTIHLVHVEPTISEANAGDAWPLVYAAGVGALFDQLQRRIPPPAGATVRTHLLHGAPAAAIDALARAEQADLIALGTHGKSFTERWRLGSVAEATIRGAPCSILVAPTLSAPT
jgi:nucleotide-binding universal stress UspA family protein